MKLFGTQLNNPLWRIKAVFLSLRNRERIELLIKRRIANLIQDPPRILVLSFLAIIILGAILLALPISAEKNSVPFIDALFTSTSAVCVTGLVTIDVGKEFSLFGEIVLLLLIQIGGLGIMTLSIIFMLMAGKKLSLTEKDVIQDTYTHSGQISPSAIAREVLQLTLIIEGTGAFFLAFRFVPEQGIVKGIYNSVFHSVSAFCNAGFALFSNNLENYSRDWLVSLTISFLIIFGGIGFLVISEIWKKFPYTRNRIRRLSLHTKLALVTTFILIVAGTCSIALLEWDNTLAGLDQGQKFLCAYFQSVSTRTAGFNTISIGNMTGVTLVLCVLLMFIGACPGSCAGGVKTTTAATLTLLAISKLRGHEYTKIFCRTIPNQSITRAINVVLVSMALIAAAVMFMLVSEYRGMSPADTQNGLMPALFETVSAFGTVGLSMGITPKLTVAGKLLISAVMFIGRLGPLMITIAISRKSQAAFFYAEENIMIG
jgi:trk system potassium uptake protein TrkH